MLALPVAAANEGFLTASLLLFFSWMVMTFGAFLILEVVLLLPENSSLISMAKLTTGKVCEVVAWLSCLLLLYSLLCAYTSGNSDVLHGILFHFHIDSPRWLDTSIVVLLFGSIVYRGISSVDIVNRFLMSAKIIAYVLMIAVIVPHLDIQKLLVGKSTIFVSTIMVMITSFGYAVIIPSLRTYFKSDVKKLRLIVLIGSLFPLVFYIFWVAAVHGVILLDELNRLAGSNLPISELTRMLNLQTGSVLVGNFSRIFTSICATTSFLGVGICLFDFFADGLKLKKHGKQGSLVFLMTFLPPFLIVLFIPGVFIKALEYAGLLCVILLMLLPAIMAWNARAKFGSKEKYQVFGGKFALLAEIIISILLIFWALIY